MPDCYWCGTPYYQRNKNDLLVPDCGCTPIRQRWDNEKKREGDDGY